jgi:hypothetical protein
LGLLDLHLVINSTELIHLKAARVRVIFMYVVAFFKCGLFRHLRKDKVNFVGVAKM